MTIGRWALLLLGISAVGCVRPARERAERDLEVGKAKNGELSVRVQHGLAAVRTLEPGHLVLWSSAPGWVLELDARSEMLLRLDVRNVMPDVELSALTEDAMVTEIEATPVTYKSFELELPAGGSRFRLAAPDAAERGAFQFALMSDVQEAIDRVQDIYTRMNEEPDIRFLLGAGDLTRRGSDAELETFEKELRALDVPYYTTLGNHELGASPCRYQDWYGRGNFQFAFRGVYFTMLDSASATLDPLVYDWLDGWLANARHGVNIVAMHVPPLDPTGVRNGSFANRGEAAALLGTLAGGRVDLTLYGHVHSYYSFSNAGIPAFISGGGGAIPERFDDIGRHFMVIAVDADRGVTKTRVVRVDPGD